MNVLFIHQNFPGQFVHLSAILAADARNRIVALTMRQNPAPNNVHVHKYGLLRQPAEHIHPMLRDEESKVLRAEACAAAAFQLKREGFEPDVIVAHPGWGEALFIKDVFPKAKLVIYCEYYYAADGQDVGFNPDEPPVSFQQRCRIRLKNTTNLLSLEIADAAISPTEWQKSTYPAWAQKKITVIHDGIDIERLAFRPDARITLPANALRGELTLKPGDEVLSYVARNLEPVRGFDMFMRTLPAVLNARPAAHIVVVGGDDVSYGARPPGGVTWRENLMAEVGGGIDLRRVHFVGKIPYQAYLQLLSVSRVHAYWTTPFVLSWSFLEAALSGLNVVASDTPPVAEFAGELGITTSDYFDISTFGYKIKEGLKFSSARRPMDRHSRLSFVRCIEQQVRLITSL